MKARKNFLLTLFRSLEQRQVPYCVARNYEDVFASITSDVDLTVEPENLAQFERCLKEAANASQYVETLRASYANFSYVFLHEQEGFLRIDVETETRWRVFPVLSAKAIVSLRRRHGEFYIPHPRHESVILLTACIWRSQVTERYRKQLAKLFDQLEKPEQLQRTFHSVFGDRASALVQYQAAATKNGVAALPFGEIRKAMIRRCLGNRPSRRATFHYLWSDIRRYFRRIVNPPGLTLVVASSASRPLEIESLLERMEFLYPAGKTNRVNLSGSGVTHLNWKTRMQRIAALFKGGLFVRYYHLQDDETVNSIVAKYSILSYASRTFVCAENLRGEIGMGHVKTGFMAEFTASQGKEALENGIIRFITSRLNPTSPGQKSSTVQPKTATRGIFVVLLGLDGSGKTTVARALCSLAGQTSHFRKARYFHWRPALTRKVRFPFSIGTNVPRKPSREPSFRRSLLSVFRLFRNLVLTKLAWSIQVNKLLQKQTLIVMDRYFYNYYLDPVSVRYYGPIWLIDQVRPAFPQPDLIVVLQAPVKTLLGRKQELSEQQIAQQNAVLDTIARQTPRSLVIDATRPASDIAREIYSKLVVIPNETADQQNPFEPVKAA